MFSVKTAPSPKMIASFLIAVLIDGILSSYAFEGRIWEFNIYNGSILRSKTQGLVLLRTMKDLLNDISSITVYGDELVPCRTVKRLLQRSLFIRDVFASAKDCSPTNSNFIASLLALQTHFHSSPSSTPITLLYTSFITTLDPIELQVLPTNSSLPYKTSFNIINHILSIHDMGTAALSYPSTPPPIDISEVDDYFDHSLYERANDSIGNDPHFTKALRVGHKMYQEMDHPDVFSFLETAVGTEHEAKSALGVSTGFILHAILEGISPTAVQRIEETMVNIMEKIVIPMVTKMLAGIDAGGTPGSFVEVDVSAGEVSSQSLKKETDPFQVFAKTGALPRTVARDLLESVPTIVSQVSTIFSTALAVDLHSSLIEIVRDTLQLEITRSITRVLTHTLPITVTESLAPSVERYIPPALINEITASTIDILTRSVTHSVTSTLFHTMNNEGFDAIERMQDENLQYLAMYNQVYASYYSDYFSEQFRK